ncbi:MAG: LCP family protein [Acidimicrobiales bacterium]
MIIASGAIVAVMAVVGAVIVGVVWWRLGNFDRVALDLATPEAPGRPMNFLVVGSDSREGVLESDADAGSFLDEGGASGQRTDTILVARVDPGDNSITLLSIPRDLYVVIDDTGYQDRINVAFADGGAQQLIDTVRRVLNIQINHYVEVNFGGFKSLVDTVGGVPMYFDTPMYDAYSGLDITQPGCVRLNGQQALAFARARHLEYLNPDTGEWEQDFTADLGRISRQQLFLRQAMDQIGGLGLTNVAKLNRLVGVATDNVTFDEDLGNTELLQLAKRFSAASSESLRTFSLPIELSETEDGASVVLLKEAEAQPVLDVFRGLEPTTTTAPAPALAPAAVAVDVRNGTGIPGQAAEAGDALSAIGFGVGQVGNAAEAGQVKTVVRYGTNARPAAQLVASFLQPGVELVADGAVAAGRVMVVTGADFAGIVLPETPAPVDAPEEVVDPLASAATTVGVSPAGQAPPGSECG